MSRAERGKILSPERWAKLDDEGNLTGEVEIFDVIEKPVERNGFMIAYLATIVQMIDKLGNQKMKVVKYILENMDNNNLLIKTTVEMSEETKISRQTISETLKILEEADIISRKTGVVMLSPKLIHKGNATKERMLIARFREVGHTRKK